MQRKNTISYKSGRQYDHLFPVPDWQDKVIKRSANLDDTLSLIPKVVAETLADTKKIAPKLKGTSIQKTAENIWNFLYYHIPYRRDEKGKEQIRRPARSWAERKRRKDGSAGGVDCDCYTVFISSILTNLQINHTLRVTKNNQDFFQHIYVVAFDEQNQQLIIDCVVDAFDYEAPFKEKIDLPMELHYLSGLGEVETTPEHDFMEAFDEEDDILDYTLTGETVDIQDFMDGDDLGFLRKLRKKVGRTIKKAGRAVGKGVRKVSHALNKFNPATVLIRTGVLLSMKLNVFNIARRIRFAYLSEAEARRRGIDLNKWRKLVQTKDRLNKIYHTAGGKPSNLTKAILSGKGNKDSQKVTLSELGALFDGQDYDENSSVEDILGMELFQEEVLLGHDQESLGDLGAVATGTALATAAGAIAPIAKILDKIGVIKEKVTNTVNTAKNIHDSVKQNIDTAKSIFQPTRGRSPEREVPFPLSPQPNFPTSPMVIRRRSPVNTLPATTAANTSTPLAPETNVTLPPDEKKGFVQWAKDNKGLLIGLGIGTVVIGGTAVYVTRKKKKKPSRGLSGTTGRRKTTTRKKTTSRKKTTNRKTTRRKTTPRRTRKVQTIALM